MVVTCGMSTGSACYPELATESRLNHHDRLATLFLQEGVAHAVKYTEIPFSILKARGDAARAAHEAIVKALYQTFELKKADHGTYSQGRRSILLAG